jgi:hypothetical protein
LVVSCDFFIWIVHSFFRNNLDEDLWTLSALALEKTFTLSERSKIPISIQTQFYLQYPLHFYLQVKFSNCESLTMKKKKTKLKHFMFQVVSLIEDVVSKDLLKELRDENFYRKYFSIDLLVESPIFFQAFNRWIDQLNFSSNICIFVSSKKSTNHSLVTSI